MAPERLQLNSFAPGMPPDPHAAWTELKRDEPLPVVITEAEGQQPAAATESDPEVRDGVARRPAAAPAAAPAAEARKRRSGGTAKD